MNRQQNRSYRRGLVLGLTMAETMILMVFALLLALSSSLAERDERIARLEQQLDNSALRIQLVEVVQKQFPRAVSYDDYFKELKAAFEAEERVKNSLAGRPDVNSLLADASLGKALRESAERAGTGSAEYGRKLLEIAGDPTQAGGWPPFINLSEADGFYFESGSAELQPEFRRALESHVIAALKTIIDHYGVNIVEVIGHTDEVPMRGISNLDDRLIAASLGRETMTGLSSSDNSGLGMARAVSVVKVLRADSRLNGITLLPYSGAQMIMPVDRPADGSSPLETASRRRIEIRVRKSTGATPLKP